MSIHDSAALEPPGTIAVVGAGPLGIEAALYGRFLGYNVTIIESDSVGHSMKAISDQPIPMLPDRCLSPLAVSAINAQSPDGPPFVLPTTIGEWIENALIKLTETDLLRGKLRCPMRVTRIEHLAIEPDEEDDVSELDAIPPDFRLSSETGDNLDAEAVILATGLDAAIPCDFALPTPYLFRIGEAPASDPERDFLLGLKQIVEVYAQLADRKSLDLYIRNPYPTALAEPAVDEEE